MKVELKPGEKVTVTLADSDGEFTISFGETKLTVEADLPDTTGRVGIIYQEDIRNPGCAIDVDDLMQFYIQLLPNGILR